MDEARELFKNEGYLLEGLLAGDAWGELYRAVYVSHRREVLFRRFVPAIGEAAPWELAAAEIQAWARVDHPGVLQPLDWGSPRAGPYLATEMPDGAPLFSLVEEPGSLDRLDPMLVFASLVDAIESARALGVLHLGLGLSNVWVAAGCEVKVSEFGLWYVHNEHTGLVALDEGFCAPEQGGTERASAATDVFALGLMLVALHGGADAAARAAGGDHGALVSSGLPAGAQAVVSRCLAADPLERPRTAGELAAALGMSQRTSACTFRDCPVCRLKEDIARDKRSRPPTVSERLRAFTGPGVMESDTRDRGAARGGSLYDSLLPWIAIATLALATFVVWWLAFK